MEAKMGLPEGYEERVARYTPDIRYDKIVEAFGGHAESVTDPDELRPALERAYQATLEGKVACVNVVTEPMDVGCHRRYPGQHHHGLLATSVRSISGKTEQRGRSYMSGPVRVGYVVNDVSGNAGADRFALLDRPVLVSRTNHFRSATILSYCDCRARFIRFRFLHQFELVAY